MISHVISYVKYINFVVGDGCRHIFSLKTYEKMYYIFIILTKSQKHYKILRSKLFLKQDESVKLYKYFIYTYIQDGKCVFPLEFNNFKGGY